MVPPPSTSTHTHTAIAVNTHRQIDEEGGRQGVLMGERINRCSVERTVGEWWMKMRMRMKPLSSAQRALQHRIRSHRLGIQMKCNSVYLY